MITYRLTNRDCMTCGGQIPVDVEVTDEEDYTAYQCPECGTNILEKITAYGGNVARVPPYIHHPRTGLPIGNPDTHWDTIERWWTDRMSVLVIHGRAVEGDERLLDFVEEVLSIYDS